MEDYPAFLEACWQEHLKPREPDAPTVISLFAGCGGSSLCYSMAGYRELLAVEWGDHAVELQRIFPNLRRLFPHLPEPPPVESEESQFSLFDAMSSFLHTVSQRVPLVLVLDDLHWADRATLQMLSHVARDLGRALLASAPN